MFVSPSEEREYRYVRDVVKIPEADTDREDEADTAVIPGPPRPADDAPAMEAPPSEPAAREADGSAEDRNPGDDASEPAGPASGDGADGGEEPATPDPAPAAGPVSGGEGTPADQADGSTEEDDEAAVRALAANDAVGATGDATRYGLSIPFTRWLIAYKAGLTAKDFAIVSDEDRALAEKERADSARAAAVPAAEAAAKAVSAPADATPDASAPSEPADTDTAGEPEGRGDEPTAGDPASKSADPMTEGTDASVETHDASGTVPPAPEPREPDPAAPAETHGTDGNPATPPAPGDDASEPAGPASGDGADGGEDPAAPDPAPGEDRGEQTVEDDPHADGDSTPADDDVLSIPEAEEVGDDRSEREALIGQFGARTQMRDTYYPNLAAFVELHVAHMWPYQQGVMTKFLWVPDWWRYPPLIYQLDALWRAYENARRQPGQMMVFNIQAFGLLDRVFNKDTGLVASLGIDENKTTTGPNEPLPCIRPPKGWRRKAMEPLRPFRPKEMEDAAAGLDRERPIRRPNIRMFDRKQQEGGR